MKRRRLWTKDEVRILKRAKRKGVSLASLVKNPIRRSAGAIYQKAFSLGA